MKNLMKIQRVNTCFVCLKSDTFESENNSIFNSIFCLQSGLTPLHVAAFMGNLNIAMFLLNHGAKVDEVKCGK